MTDRPAPGLGPRFRSWPPAGRDVLLVLLAVAAGAVDAVSFLGLGRVFTANMTGNTVLLGIAVGQGQGDAIVRSVVALGGFGLGAALAALLVHGAAGESDWPRAVTAAVAGECCLLVALAVVWQVVGHSPSIAAENVLVAVAAIAMGAQSAAVQRLGVRGVATTYITGTLTTLVMDLVGHLRGPARPHDAASGEATLELRAAIWGGVAVGAVAGGAAEVGWHESAAFVPLGVVAVVAALAAAGVGRSAASQRRASGTKSRSS